MQPLVSVARQRLLELGRWSVLLCMLSLPISKAATNIFIFFALLGSLGGSDVRQRCLHAFQQPVPLGACAWFGVLALSWLYGGSAGRWGELGVYKALSYPLLVASLLDTTRWRNRGLFAFGLGAALVLALSLGQLFGLPPLNESAQTDETYRFTVFKEYTQQGVACLLLACMAASWAMTSADFGRKCWLWLLAGVATINVLFMLQSRTAYLAALPLLSYWAWRLLAGSKGILRKTAIGAGGLALIAATVWTVPHVQERLNQAQHDVERYQSRQEPGSLGIRLELWKRTLPIIASAPWLGHGLGQWKAEYQRQTVGVPDFDKFRQDHPHQEALYILSEQGVVGLAAFALLLLLLAKYIGRLELPQRDFYRCVLLTYLTSALPNCVLVDFSHRHVFLMLLACIPLIAHQTPQ